ncbi:MAG: hypothetical protein QG652_828 [Pseudomonadota bacterium]|nr:hypothetical protein [Pseudomonadota bacterium]
MKTECPHCHTVFRVTEQTLQQCAGQVRCGHCLAIFTAEIPQQMSFDDLLAVRDEIPQTDAENAAADTLQDIPDEMNAEAEIPEPVMESGTDENPATEKQHHVLPDVIPPSLRAEYRAGEKYTDFVSGLFWSLAIWLMIIIGFAQYAWYDRQRWLQYPQTRAWYERACEQLKCELPEPRDLLSIDLIRKNIYTHPNNKHGLMVSGTMINQAEFAQAFPLLELRFENIRGEAIAARRFKPAEYLDLPEDRISTMQPGEPVAFTLEIIDPGQDVVSYEFTFL